MSKTSRFKEYIAWCWITFLVVASILSVVPLGINGETPFDICGVTLLYVLSIITPLANLVILDSRFHN